MWKTNSQSLENLVQEMLDEAAQKLIRHEISRREYICERRAALTILLSDETYDQYRFDEYKAGRRLPINPYLDSSESQQSLIKRDFVLAPWDGGTRWFRIVEGFWYSLDEPKHWSLRKRAPLFYFIILFSLYFVIKYHFNQIQYIQKKSTKRYSFFLKTLYLLVHLVLLFYQHL